MNTISEIATILKNVKSAVIFTHTRPDGDALGSSMALSRAFFYLNIPCEVVNDCAIPDKFLFLEGMADFQKTPTLNADAYICVDCSDEARLGTLQDTYLAGARKKITVNIDHHVSNTRFAKYNYVRNCSSNCENMTELLMEMGIKMDGLMGNYLMLGMMTDSGCFTHNDVNADTFRRAAIAAEAGGNVDLINQHVFRNQKRAHAELHAYAFSHLRYLLDDKLAISLVTQEKLSELSATADMTEGIVDFALSVDTVEVSVALLEMRKGQYKASLRSKGKVNVNQVAATYGGGGHVLASGCMLYGDVEEVIDRLRYTVYQHLEER